MRKSKRLWPKLMPLLLLSLNMPFQGCTPSRQSEKERLQAPPAIAQQMDPYILEEASRAAIKQGHDNLEFSSIKYLALNPARVESLRGVERLTNLEYLNIGESFYGSEVPEHESLLTCEMGPTDLNTAKQKLPLDLTPLSGLPLKVFYVTGRDLANINALGEIEEIEILSLRLNKPYELFWINKLSKLRFLRVASGHLRNLSFLELTRLSSLEAVDLQGNSCEDITSICLPPPDSNEAQLHTEITINLAFAFSPAILTAEQDRQISVLRECDIAICAAAGFGKAHYTFWTERSGVNCPSAR